MAKLNIRLNSRSETSKAQQIADQIADAIKSGKLRAGDPIQSERSLAEQLGVARITVKRAYKVLNDRKLVETMGTAGRRVRTGSQKGIIRPVTGAKNGSRNRSTGKLPGRQPVTARGSKKR
jgi:DNA-binding GntR family transcriptional regulator